MFQNTSSTTVSVLRSLPEIEILEQILTDTLVPPYNSALFKRLANDPPIVTPNFIKLSKDSQYHIDRLISDSRRPFESKDYPPKWVLPSVYANHEAKFARENPGIYRAILHSIPGQEQNEFRSFLEAKENVAPVFWEKLAKGPTGDALAELMEAHRDDVEPATEQSLRATPDNQSEEQPDAEQVQLVRFSSFLAFIILTQI